MDRSRIIGMMVDHYQVHGCLLVMVLPDSLGFCFAASVHGCRVVLGRLNRPFCLDNFSPGSFSPGSKIARLPSQVDRTSPCNSSCGQLGSRSPTVGPLRGRPSTTPSPCRSTSGLCSPSVALLDFSPGLALQWRFMSTPCLAICPRLQHLGFCGGGCLSPTSRLDAGGALSHGRYSSHNQ